MTNASSATVRVPAAAPKSSTAVNTNVSEIEMVAGTEGSLTVADPLINVRTASTSHRQLSGRKYSSTAADPMIKKPTEQTAKMYPLVQEAMRSGLYVPNRASFLCSRKYCPHWQRCEDEYGGKVDDK